MKKAGDSKEETEKKDSTDVKIQKTEEQMEKPK